MVINIVMTLLFGYVYLSIFTAFFIGNIRNPVGFFIMYGLHIAFTVIAIVTGFFHRNRIISSASPFHSYLR